MTPSSSKKTLRYWSFYAFWVIVPVITVFFAATMYGWIAFVIPFAIIFFFGVITYVLQDLFWDEYEKVYGEKR